MYRALILTLLILGCSDIPEENPVEKCLELCNKEKNIIDMESGPCLDNEIIEGWVCDVSHSPRLEIDSLIENQCPGMREGYHFVEVSTDCNLIKVY